MFPGSISFLQFFSLSTFQEFLIGIFCPVFSVKLKEIKNIHSVFSFFFQLKKQFHENLEHQRKVTSTDIQHSFFQFKCFS